MQLCHFHKACANRKADQGTGPWCHTDWAQIFRDLACAIDGTNVPAYLYADHSKGDKKNEIIVDVTDARYLMPNDPQSCDQGFTTESVFLPIITGMAT